MPRKLKSARVFPEESFPLTVLRHDDHGVCGLHRHEFHELVVILAGRGRHMTETRTYPLEAGDVFLIRGDMAHGYSEAEDMTLVNILFDPKRLDLPLTLLRDLPGYHALFRVEPRLRTQDRFRSRLRLTEEELAAAAGMIARLQQELDRRKPGFRFLAFANLMHLIGFLSRCYTHETRTAERPLLRIGEVMSYIEQHYREPISIRQLTRLAAMSESSLARAFHRVLGRSPIEQVIRVRVLRAADLLRQGQRVTEAAFACGFNDSNYFSRQFRRVMRQSPRAFRDKHLAPTGKPAPVRRRE
jgi:AraC-like DNA-binding protein/quercetin dioxygenase-like cupin family protein